MKKLLATVTIKSIFVSFCPSISIAVHQQQAGLIKCKEVSMRFDEGDETEITTPKTTRQWQVGSPVGLLEFDLVGSRDSKMFSLA